MGSYLGRLQELCDYRRTREKTVVLSRFTASPKNLNELLTNYAILIDPKNKYQKSGQQIAAMGGKILYGTFQGPLPEQVTLFCLWTSVLAKDSMYHAFIRAFKLCLDDDDLKFTQETHESVICMEKSCADECKIKSDASVDSADGGKRNTAISFVTIDKTTFKGEESLRSAINSVPRVDVFGCTRGPKDDEMQLFVIWETLEAADDNEKLLEATLKETSGLANAYTCKACVFKSAPTA